MTWRTLLTLLSVRNGKRLADGIRGALKMLEDLRANSWSLRPCCMVLAYRVAHFLFGVAQKRTSSTIFGRPRCWCCIALSPNAFSVMKSRPPRPLVRRFTIHHGYAVVINKKRGGGGMISPFATASLSAIGVPITWHVHTLATASNSVPTSLFLVISRLVTTSPWARAAWCSTLSRTTRWWWEKKARVKVIK